MKTILNLALVVFSLIGIADASYISYEKIIGAIPSCTAYFQCGDVLSSQWSSIGPVPLSVLGLMFYCTFLLVAIANFLELTTIQIREIKLKIPLLLKVLGVTGFLFSGYLVFLMAFVIKAWCLYCLISAFNCVVLFMISGPLLSRFKPEESV